MAFTEQLWIRSTAAFLRVFRFTFASGTPWMPAQNNNLNIKWHNPDYAPPFHGITPLFYWRNLHLSHQIESSSEIALGRQTKKLPQEGSICSNNVVRAAAAAVPGMILQSCRTPRTHALSRNSGRWDCSRRWNSRRCCTARRRRSREWSQKTWQGRKRIFLRPFYEHVILNHNIAKLAKLVSYVDE